MKNNKIAKVFTGFMALAMILTFVPVNSASALSPVNSQNTEETRMSRMKSKANQEIDRRVNALNKLIVKINEMKKISEGDKATLVATLSTNITNLTALKAKIAADTDMATLKIDVQSITKDYRIFMLVLKKVSILAAAERMEVTADSFTTVNTALSAGIASAVTAGKDVTSMNAWLSDMNAKVADAKIQYANAKAAVINLVPDNGVQAVIDSNKAALESARTMIKNGATDLHTAREDAKKIRSQLRAYNIVF